MSRGRVIRARAMAMRWRWPPENSCRVFVQVWAQAHLGEHFSGLLALLRPRGVALGLQRFADDPSYRSAVGPAIRTGPGTPSESRAGLRAARPLGNWWQIAPQQAHAAGGGRVQRHHGARQADLPEPDSPTTPRRAAVQREAHAFERLHFGGRAQQVLAGALCIREPGRSLAAAGLWALARLGWAGAKS